MLAVKPEPEFIPTKIACEIICRTENWMRYARRHAGLGPPYYRIGGKVFYRRPEIMSWLRSNRRE